MYFGTLHVVNVLECSMYFGTVHVEVPGLVYAYVYSILDVLERSRMFFEQRLLYKAHMRAQTRVWNQFVLFGSP